MDTPLMEIEGNSAASKPINFLTQIIHFFSLLIALPNALLINSTLLLNLDIRRSAGSLFL